VKLENLNGLVVVNSEPKNQGGKTTFSVDVIKFLIFGNTTKTDKNEQIFNQYSDNNEVIVKGMIELDGEEIVIERKLTRSPKRAGGWTVKGVLNYYSVQPDGEYQKQNEDHAGSTTKKIKETIGLESDFELVVLATARNIDDIIDQTTTESGKLLARFIGLEIISFKEVIVRKMSNDFNKNMKSNIYSTPDLEADIITLQTSISENQASLITSEADLVNVKVKHGNKVEEKEVLMGSKEKVDVEIASLDPSMLDKKLADTLEEGNTMKEKIANLNQEIKDLGVVDFDEDRHDAVLKEMSKISAEIAVNESEIKNITDTIKMLEAGQICNTCNRPLDDVDNTVEIQNNNGKIVTKQKHGIVKGRELENLNTELNNLNKVKESYDNKNKLELKRDRAEVEIQNLRNRVREVQADIKKYNDNLDAINKNVEIDSKIEKVKSDIRVIEHERDTLVSNVQILKNNITNDEKSVLTKEKLIKEIAKEEEIGRLFKIYIEMIGKKGITKLVLRSVLPILNSEVSRLLDEVCDFDVEIFMDDKNDVRYLLVKDDVEKPLKSASGFERTVSSLAIRVVLGKMSALPMPNFITFDEVLGRVAEDNVTKMEPFFQKVKDMFDVVFFITHDDTVKDWADTIITIKKTNNISKLSVN
jgi:DNA repair exonuclease SbcCD ATPase subunit